MLNEDYKEILQCLDGEDVKFLLVGACGLAAHGYPRATGEPRDEQKIWQT